MLAQRAELSLKKQKTIVEKKEAKKEESKKDAAAAAEAEAEQAAQDSEPQSVLKLRQFAMISSKHKNEMMDRYY